MARWAACEVLVVCLLCACGGAWGVRVAGRGAWGVGRGAWGVGRGAWGVRRAMPSSRAIVRMVDAMVAYSAAAAAYSAAAAALPASPAAFALALSTSARMRLVAIRVRTSQSGLVITSVSPPASAAALQWTSDEVAGRPAWPTAVRSAALAKAAERHHRLLDGIRAARAPRPLGP